MGIDVQDVHQAVLLANDTIALIYALTVSRSVPIFKLLGLRNLSSFVGELFASQLNSAMEGKVMPNPHQDGYPDLMAMTSEGIDYYNKAVEKGETVKQQWSPFPYGGIEVKSTCGNTPAASKVPKPAIGSSRIELLDTFEWKAHHRDTNNY